MAYSDSIEYLRFASLGNATDFGDLVGESGHEPGAVSDSTKGIWGGGTIDGGTEHNRIDYVTISSLGNATDFGDMHRAQSNNSACDNNTKGYFHGGYATGVMVNIICYINMASLGDTTDAGDLTTNTSHMSACSGAAS